MVSGKNGLIVLATGPNRKQVADLTPGDAKSETCCRFERAHPAYEAPEEAFQRIELLHGQFGKAITDQVLVAYRLGIELRTLRDKTRHGEWEKLFKTKLTFIRLRNANNYICLGRVFKSEAELRGLTLTQAVKLARKILRGDGLEQAQDRSNRIIQKIRTLRNVFNRMELAEEYALIAAEDHKAVFELLADVVRAAENGSRQLSTRSRAHGSGPMAACGRMN